MSSFWQPFMDSEVISMTVEGKMPRASNFRNLAKRAVINPKLAFHLFTHFCIAQLQTNNIIAFMTFNLVLPSKSIAECILPLALVSFSLLTS